MTVYFRINGAPSNIYSLFYPEKTSSDAFGNSGFKLAFLSFKVNKTGFNFDKVVNAKYFVILSI